MKIRNVRQTIVFGSIVFGILFINGLYLNSINGPKFQPTKKDLTLRTSYYNNSAEPIFIDGDATGVGAHNWSWAENRPWCSGIGTWDEPYIIANLTIDAKSSTSCINISNSDVFFRIKNCTLHNSSSTPSGAGIELHNVGNGTIVDNNCSNNYYGIYFEGINNNTVSNNNITNNVYKGISLETSNNNTFLTNLISNHGENGIYLDESHNNTFWNNKVIDIYRDSIQLYRSNNNTFWYNTVSYSNRIYLYYSHNNTFWNNTVSYSDLDSIYLYYSHDNTLLTNTVVNSSFWAIGIHLNYSNDNTLLMNKVSNNTEDGIHLEYSNNNTLLMNNVSNNTEDGIHLEYSNYNSLLTNNVSNNNEYGIHLEYSNNSTLLTNTVINNFYGFYTYGSHNNTLSNNTISINDFGISLRNSVDNDLTINKISNNIFNIISLLNSNKTTLTNNTLSNSMFGIGISGGQNNTLLNNTISNNEYYGISLSNTYNNTISNNTIIDNVNSGIELSSTTSNNTIFLNYLINNTPNALDDGSKNQWDNGSIGNYWDDYDGVDADDDGIGEFPYNISGSAKSQDNYPIWYDGPFESLAPTWDQVPTDQTVEYGDSFYYDVNASDHSPPLIYWINDTSNFQIDTNGVITNVTVLPVNIYWLEIGVNDTYQNSRIAVIKITVQENIPPTWDEVPEDQIIIEYGESLSYDVSASDPSGIDSYWISDTLNFHIDSNGLITNVIPLSVDSYWLEVRVNDTYGNYNNAFILIIVQDTTPPTWDETPTNQIIEHGTSFKYDVNASDLSGIDYYWINDTSNFNIDANGVIINIVTLSVGEYSLIISVFDPYGNSRGTGIKITVETVERKAHAKKIIPGYNIVILLGVFGTIYGIYLKGFKKKKYL